MARSGRLEPRLSEQFMTAQAAESAAITALHQALKSGVTDPDELMALTDRMNDAHHKKMDAWDIIKKSY